MPENYDEYYLAFVKSCLRYACPVSAALYLLFFGYDLLFIHSKDEAIRTLLLRLFLAGCILTVWRIAPRIQSLRLMTLTISALYVIGFLDLITILWLLPGGLVIGIPGLLIVMMLGTGLFFLRPLPAGICGAIGLAALLFAFYTKGLNFQEATNGIVYFTSGMLVTEWFLILLDRDLRRIHAAERSLEKEKAHSEKLLKEILPRYVIHRIREGAQNIAESVSEVNVIFIDIVGFTAMSRKLAPKHLVEVLGELFHSFDEKCEKYGVTKIKTIGDAYMAATGAPEPSTLSAVAAIEFCFEAISSVEEIAKRTGIPLQVRVGVATGAVISGVLSLKRPAYDLWGETVNLAARMESTSQPGKVHIAETTYWRVKDKFQCEPRELVDVKGMGPIQTYFVNVQGLDLDSSEALESAATAQKG